MLTTATAFALASIPTHAAAPSDAVAPVQTAAAPATTSVIHPDVQRALDYQLRTESCVKPIVRKTNQNAGQIEKAERASKRYISCLEDYQKGLFEDFKFMQTAVSHGVTMPQAAKIKEHLEQIATTIKGMRSRGVELQQDQGKILSTLMSGPRQMPGAANVSGGGMM